MKRLYYLRHGLSQLNVDGLFAGSTDTPLVKEGQEKAFSAGQNAKGIQIDLVISSPMSRTLDTAKFFCKGAGINQKIIQTNDLLKEREFGSLERTTYDPKISRSLLDDNLPEGVESWTSLLKRAKQLVEYINSLQAENILLVGHGAIGRAIRHILEPDADIHAGIPNSELVRWI